MGKSKSAQPNCSNWRHRTIFIVSIFQKAPSFWSSIIIFACYKAIARVGEEIAFCGKVIVSHPEIYQGAVIAIVLPATEESRNCWNCRWIVDYSVFSLIQFHVENRCFACIQNRCILFSVIKIKVNQQTWGLVGHS